MTVPIVVNGSPHDAHEGDTIAALLARLGLEGRPCAVERNREVVPRRDHAHAVLHPGDQLEIVTLVGGG
jgi:thiamine biosynthesis protein ThiS